MKKGLERDIQKAIIDYLKIKRFVVFKHQNVGIKKPNGSYIPLPAGDIGISDIIACSPLGEFVAIEVKRPGGVVSESQRAFIERVKLNGGIAFVAYSIDDVIAQLK